MRNTIELQGKDSGFIEPFIVYDTISVYDKSANKYTPKKRSTAISYSNVGEIIISMTVCSNKDAFVKSIASKILHGRIKKALDQYFNTAEDIYLTSNVEGTYIFTDIQAFNQFCNTIDNLGKQFFTPYNVEYAASLTNSTTTSKLTSFSEVYLHREYVNRSYSACVEEFLGTQSIPSDNILPFMEELSLDTSPVQDEIASKQHSDIAVSK
jgi:hypothetical protein